MGGKELLGPEGDREQLKAMQKSDNGVRGFHGTHFACFYLSFSGTYALITAKNVLIFIPV